MKTAIYKQYHFDLIENCNFQLKRSFACKIEKDNRLNELPRQSSFSNMVDRFLSRLPDRLLSILIERIAKLHIKVSGGINQYLIS